MKPALSVIFFTTFSGAGYGLLALIGLAGFIGFPAQTDNLGYVGLGLALALVFITGGLLSSSLHLEHPERAWRGLTQWRSSWLSREAVLAIITYGPAFVLVYGWVILKSSSGFYGVIGLVASFLAISTVCATAMIYMSLNSIQRWTHKFVLLIYVGFAVQLGCVWFIALMSLIGTTPSQLYIVLGAATLLVWGMKVIYWRDIDQDAPRSTIQSATGLEGEIEPFDPPHTEENFLLHEMGYKIGRKHATKLRRIALILGAGLPLLYCVMGAVSMAGFFFSFLTFLVAISTTIGALVERWLFFAEAKHASQLYY